METAVCPVVLAAWSGGPTTAGVATVAWPGLGARVVSALKVIGLGLVVGVALLPVPLVHFAGVGMFLACLGVGIWRLRPGPRVRKVEGPCPHCGHEQQYWIGVNLGPMKLPKDTSCEKCAKTLTIEGQFEG